MGMGRDSVMVIHGGGTYGDKPGAMYLDGYRIIICFPLK